MKYDELISKLCERAPWCPDTEAKLMAEAANAIVDLISALKASNDVIVKNKPKWIPVAERLPDTDKCVLVISYGRVCFAKLLLTINNGGYPTFVLQDGLNNPPVLETTAHNEFTENRITHWQYLPEPPKEETDG